MDEATKRSDFNIVMEYMDRGTLKELMDTLNKMDKKGKPMKLKLKEKIAWYICFEVLTGLNYLKKMMIQHRDIKPSNICLNSKGEVKIIDFGTSSQNEHLYQYKETFIGTMVYLAPEMWLKNKYIAEKSDIFSLGVAIYKFLFSQHPYLPDTINETNIENTYY